MTILSMMCIVLVGTLVAKISNHLAACEVDPSDQNSILLEQLKVQSEQLKVDKQLLDQLSQQLLTQNKQIDVLRQLLAKPSVQTPGMTIFVSVTCTCLGFIALILLKRLVDWLLTRYRSRPEMPQAVELNDFTQSQTCEATLLLGPRPMKSPAETSREFE